MPEINALNCLIVLGISGLVYCLAVMSVSCQLTSKVMQSYLRKSVTVLPARLSEYGEVHSVTLCCDNSFLMANVTMPDGELFQISIGRVISQTGDLVEVALTNMRRNELIELVSVSPGWLWTERAVKQKVDQVIAGWEAKWVTEYTR